MPHTLRTEELFSAALRIDDPHERQQFLEHSCADDPLLLRRVTRLLKAHGRAGDFLQQSPLAELLGPADPDTPQPGQTPGPQADGAVPDNLPERYVVAGEIARGGMGAILRGHDRHLDREVAIKVLLAAPQLHDGLTQRFLNEARIAGQLQHPGIVPIYEMDDSQPTRPFFTMKLVRGKTLAQLLKERIPGDLPRLLAVFEQVCQAVAYAHSQGVIHRDLKPANIMVGSFGEVQVMDWGLARRTGTPESPSSVGTAPDDALPHDQTQAGIILGTPGYMAPEQARGESDRVGPRTDVFGLGAMLCEILTGAPVFVGSSTEALRLSRSDNLAEALDRLHRSGADPELLQLARVCLAPDPDARPAEAGVVAEAILAHRRSVAERLRQAETQRAEAQLQSREERKRRRQMLVLGSALLLLLALGAVAGVTLVQVRSEHQAEQARIRADRHEVVAAGLARAEELRRQERWAEARAVLDQAAQVAEEGDDLHDRLHLLRDEMVLVGRIDDTLLDAIRWRQTGFDLQPVVQEIARSLRESGLGGVDDPPEEVAERIRRSDVGPVLIAALEYWVIWSNRSADSEWLLATIRLADPHKVRNHFRHLAVLNSREELDRLVARHGVTDLTAALTYMVGNALNHVGGDGLAVLRQGIRLHPSDFWLHFHLGQMLITHERAEEAVGYLRAAASLRPGNSPVLTNLGIALASRQHYDEANACFQRAIQIDPGNFVALQNLSTSLGKQGKLDESLRTLKQAHALSPSSEKILSNMILLHMQRGEPDRALVCCHMLASVNPRDPDALNSLGALLFNQGRRADEAAQQFERALAVRPNHAQVWANLGIVRRYQNRLDDAIHCFRTSLSHQPNSGFTHDLLAQVLLQRGLPDQALVHFRQALSQGHRTPATHTELGLLLMQRDQRAAALEQFRAALAMNARFGPAFFGLGVLLTSRGELNEAETALRRAVENLPPQDPRRGRSAEMLAFCQWARDHQRDLPAVLAHERPLTAEDALRFARLCQFRGDFTSAAALYLQAGHLQPQLVESGDSGYRLERLLAAIRASQTPGLTRNAEQARARWRRQALSWLVSDLHLVRRLRQQGREAQAGAVLRRYWESADLEPTRQPGWIESLPVEEQDTWKELWRAWHQARQLAV
ncbi:MAG: tetratricopeptide repeat protein [Gemmataceae bacterium]